MVRYAFEFNDREDADVVQFIVAPTLSKAWKMLANESTDGMVPLAKAVWVYVRKVSPTQDPELFK